VTWAIHGGVGTAGQGTGPLALEYTGAIEPVVEKLELLATPTEPLSNDEVLRAPPLCVVAWGNRGMKPFRCEIRHLAERARARASSVSSRRGESEA